MFDSFYHMSLMYSLASKAQGRDVVMTDSTLLY